MRNAEPTLRGLLSGGGGAGGRIGGVVAVAGAGDEFAAAARGDYFDAYGAIGAVGAEVGRIVAENVLVADVVGDLVADVVNILHVFREIGEAAGGVGDFLEGFFGFGFGFALLFAQQA